MSVHAGLTTSAIPYGDGVFDIEFDFIDHQLHIRASDGRRRQVALTAKPVAQFYAETMAALGELDIQTRIHARPNEVEPAIPFAEDYDHASYEPVAAEQFWRQLLQANRVIGRFRSSFRRQGKPGAFLLGRDGSGLHPVLRAAGPAASGRRPELPDLGDAGGLLPPAGELRLLAWWGRRRARSTRTPTPNRTASATTRCVRPWRVYDVGMGEFLLPYEEVADADDPDRTVAEFLETTYAAAAELGGWDRAALEADPQGRTTSVGRYPSGREE